MATTFTLDELPDITFTVTVGGTDPLTGAQLSGGYVRLVGTDSDGNICYRFGGDGGTPMPVAVADDTTSSEEP